VPARPCGKGTVGFVKDRRLKVGKAKRWKAENGKKLSGVLLHWYAFLSVDISLRKATFGEILTCIWGGGSLGHNFYVNICNVEFGSKSAFVLGLKKTMENLYGLGRSQLVYIIFKNSVRTAKKTQHFTVTKMNRLTLFKEIIGVCSESHTERVNKPCEQSAQLLTVKAPGTYSYRWVLQLQHIQQIPELVLFRPCTGRLWDNVAEIDDWTWKQVSYATMFLYEI
jgi:hypothetical protein